MEFLENTVPVNRDMTITYEYGVATQRSFDYISSDSNVFIGAFSPIEKTNQVMQNYFYGTIDAVALYDVILSPSQISKLHENNRESECRPYT